VKHLSESRLRQLCRIADLTRVAPSPTPLPKPTKSFARSLPRTGSDQTNRVADRGTWAWIGVLLGSVFI